VTSQFSAVTRSPDPSAATGAYSVSSPRQLTGALLIRGLGPGHSIGTDYGGPVGGGACRHADAKQPDAPRRDLADVLIPTPGHAAALVQPLNPDPNAPGVHRSVVEHTPG